MQHTTRRRNVILITNHITQWLALKLGNEKRNMFGKIAVTARKKEFKYTTRPKLMVKQYGELNFVLKIIHYKKTHHYKKESFLSR